MVFGMVNTDNCPWIACSTYLKLYCGNFSRIIFTPYTELRNYFSSLKLMWFYINLISDSTNILWWFCSPFRYISISWTGTLGHGIDAVDLIRTTGRMCVHLFSFCYEYSSLLHQILVTHQSLSLLTPNARAKRKLVYFCHSFSMTFNRATKVAMVSLRFTLCNKFRTVKKILWLGHADSLQALLFCIFYCNLCSAKVLNVYIIYFSLVFNSTQLNQ